jgi:hypothetical protein
MPKMPALWLISRFNLVHPRRRGFEELYHKPVQCIQWQKRQRNRCYRYRGRWLHNPYKRSRAFPSKKHYALLIAKASTQGPTGVDDPS